MVTIVGLVHLHKSPLNRVFDCIRRDIHSGLPESDRWQSQWWIRNCFLVAPLIYDRFFFVVQQTTRDAPSNKRLNARQKTEKMLLLFDRDFWMGDLRNIYDHLRTNAFNGCTCSKHITFEIIALRHPHMFPYLFRHLSKCTRILVENFHVW